MSRKSPIYKIKFLKCSDTKISKKCLDGYTLKNFLACGGNGSVYNICNLKDDCNYVVKIQPIDFDVDESITDWKREACISKILNVNFNIGAKVFGAWMCKKDGVGIIIFEKWDGTLKPNECLSKNLLKKLADQIDTINKLGYVHGDILLKNILVKRNEKDKIIDVTLTDFGTLTTAEEWKEWERDYNFISTFYNYILSNLPDKNYYTINNISLQNVIDDPFQLDKGLIYHLRKIC